MFGPQSNGLCLQLRKRLLSKFFLKGICEPQVPRRHNVCRGGTWRNRPVHRFTTHARIDTMRDSVQSRWRVAGGPRRGRRAAGSPREHRALPAAQDGRDRHLQLDDAKKRLAMMIELAATDTN